MFNDAFEADDILPGDPRRCPRHGEVTSSPDGLHDAPCGACEYEADTGESSFVYEARLRAQMALPAPPPPPADDDILF